MAYSQTPHWVYVIQCKTPNTYYVGMTYNIEKRLSCHAGLRNRPPKFIEKHGYERLLTSTYILGKQHAKDLESYTVSTWKYLFPTDTVAGGGYNS